jgi:hypothetical protein
VTDSTSDSAEDVSSCWGGLFLLSTFFLPIQLAAPNMGWPVERIESVKRKRWWCTHAQSLTRKHVIKFPHFIVEKQGKERRQITATIKERTKT